MLAGARRSLAKELFAPSPERIERTLQITIMTMIVVVISMTFQIPDPALSAYIVFFVAKEDSGRSILISVVFIVAIVVVVAVVFLLLPISLDHPQLRILVIAAASFVMFFLGRTSKLAPLAGTLGLIMASALNLEQKAPIGEIATRALLYVLLFAIFPIVVVLVFNIVFGRHPERLLRESLGARLDVVSGALRGSASSRHWLKSMIASGNVELLTELKMIGLLRRLPRDTTARLKALVTLTYSQLLVVEALQHQAVAAAPPDQEIVDKLDYLAKTIRHLPTSLEPSPQSTVELAQPTGDLPQRVSALTAMMEGIVSGAPLPAPSAALVEQPKSGFFKPDAFSSPDGERFAAKATAAVMICYLTFNLLDWPGISTCMITCFIVALSTVGESAQKMTLRLIGCTFGAALGYVAIVFVLPATTQISGLLVLVAFITVPAAWIAVGSPRVAYIGFQIAFAAYLCVLQGTEPKFDLTIARDRFIGIVFGNVTVFVIFTQFYATSLLPGLSKDLVAILDRCRAILKAFAETKPTLAISEQVASLYALVGKIDSEVIAYGFEKRPTRFGHLHVLSCQLISRALHNVVTDIATIAVRGSPLEDLPTKQACDRGYAAVDRRLEDLATALAERKPIVVGQAEEANLGGGEGSAAADTICTSEFDVLHSHLDSLGAAASRYRRILRKEAEGAYA